MQALQEDFDFGGLDVGKWSTFGSTPITIGTDLDIQLTSLIGGGYGGLVSIVTDYDMTSSYAFSQLTDAGNQALTSWEVYPVELAYTDNSVSIMISGNTIYARKKVATVSSTVGSTVAYNSAVHKWFRIREASGTTYWEFATDPAGSWTEIANAANPITMTSLTGGITIGTWQAEASTTTAKLDNFNVLPGSLQFSWKGYTWNKRIHAGDPADHKTWSTSNITGPDGSDYMTLKLTNAGGNAPIGGEIFTDTRGFGYGVYTTTIGTRLDNSHAAVVFGGMYIFDFTVPPAYREIDVNEVKTYGANPNKRILHSHVWDNTGVGTFITDDMDVPSDAVQTHRLIWLSDILVFDSYLGTGTEGTHYFHTEQTTHLPAPNLERVHFNVWVDDDISGYAAATAIDVVVRDFTFSPLASAVTSSISSNGRVLDKNISLMRLG